MQIRIQYLSEGMATMMIRGFLPFFGLTCHPTSGRMPLEIMMAVPMQVFSAKGSVPSGCKGYRGRHLYSSTPCSSSVQEFHHGGETAHTNPNPNPNPNPPFSHRPFFRIYYNDVYQVQLPPRHRFPMGKYTQVRTKLQQWISELPQEEQDLVHCEFVVSPLATVEELATTHSREYIQRFLNGDQTEREQRNVGFPWSPEGVDRALSSVGGTVAAACSVCAELERTADASDDVSDASVGGFQMPPWAAHVAGGTHHAFYDYGEGFSVFSDIAVAANVVLERYPSVIKRILIIDLDVHQGNGNAVLFQGRPEVSTFSIHCEGNYFSEKQSSDLDVELPIGCNDATYLMTLHHWLKRIEKHTGQEGDHYDLAFFQAGVDILIDDRLGRMNISAQGVQRRNELVYDFARRLNLPLVICMGGGYPSNLDDWTPIINAHTMVYFQAHQFLSQVAKSASS